MRQALTAVFVAAARGKSMDQPNILFILCDDLGCDYAGYGEATGTYGPTPVLDAARAIGMTFRRAYASPVCSPTRLGLMTGEYPHRWDVGDSIDYDGSLPLPAVDGSYEHLPLVIRDMGYRTAAIGKWHLANHVTGGMTHPMLIGFDTHVGTKFHVDDYYAWERWVAGTSQGIVTEYATSAVVNDALDVIDGFSGDPWYVHVAFQAPHKPYHVPPAGLTTIDLSGSPSEATQMRAVVQALDSEIGRLLSGLRPAVLAKTIVFIMGDNGTPGSAVQDGKFDPGKGSVEEHGVRVPLIVFGPGVEQGESDDLVSHVDIPETIAELCGTAMPERDGVSFVDVLTGTGPGTRSVTFANRQEPNGSAGPYVKLRRSARNANWRLVHEQLNDTKTLWSLGSGTHATKALPPYTSEQQAAYDSLLAALGEAWL